ncbi:O-antigen ligase family protein [Halobacteriovorax sp. JY17]|uniref:O-antigen ligase family protein n=1 Tax=Halobacteriovorax sp. JY17 TaxID=2014617 RepID=UPI000C5D38D5|nr:O-antigen ligase family protein [Halobacteriovorax sp. JY17]PIK14696.1 MAG: hypothetical protein CES88_10180 [Halobacteriovorax sp. JY17]
MKMLTSENTLFKMTYASVWAIVLFSFVSLSASALSHILIFIPALYFTFKTYKEEGLNLSKSNIALLLTILFAIISIIFAPDIARKFKQVTKLKYMLIGVLAIYPFIELFKKITRDQVRKMFNTFLVLLAVGNLAGVYALFSGYHPLRMKEASDGLRAAGMYGMAITYGYGIELILILMLAITFLYRKKISNIANPAIFYISMGTTLIGFYFAFARGALLALIISIPFIFIRRNRKIFLGLLTAGVTFIGIITAIVFTTNEDGGGNRFLLKAKTTSNMIRLSQYEAAYKGFLEKPLTGWGYRNFEPNAYDIKKRNGIDYAEFYGHAHNNYLEFLASTGVFGFISFCLFVLFWIVEAFKRGDEFSNILFPFIISFSISGLFQNTINDGENMFVIMFLYSLTYSLRPGLKIFERD